MNYLIYLIIQSILKDKFIITIVIVVLLNSVK